MHLSVYRRDNRKRSARSWRRRLWLAGGMALVCLLIVVVYQWGGHIRTAAGAARAFVLENPYFSVREIQVRGGEKVGGSEIVAMAGLKHGMNMWKVEPAAIEQKIARHPWVHRVVVRREFPRRVVIEVEERTPKAIVAMGKLYYVDSDGVVFKDVGPGENVNFPLLTGLRSEQLASSNPAIRQKIQDAMRLGELMTQDSHTLSEIHFDASDRVVLYTTSYPVALHMGWGDWNDKVKRLDRVLGLWKGHEDRLSSLDVSFRDQVVARIRRAKP
jgi:cell division protein FtsQ